jgi:hypothetical protein
LETPADTLSGGEDVAYDTLTRWLARPRREAASEPPSGAAPATLDENTRDPPPTLVIRTRTRSFFLPTRIEDYEQMFWHVPVMPYERPSEGVVAKQMRLWLSTPEDESAYATQLRQQQHPDMHVCETRDGPHRFVQVGIYGKQLRVHSRRERKAFAYCFVVYLRWRCGAQFRETHVKLFNTGQIDIPGMDMELTDTRVLHLLWRHVFAPHAACTPTHPRLIRGFAPPPTQRHMLLNSSFHMGFHIHIEALRAALVLDVHALLFHDTRMTIRCKYVIDAANDQLTTLSADDQWMRLSGRFDSAKYHVVSCRVFWTGSVLISGACPEPHLTRVAHHLHRFLQTHRQRIAMPTESVHRKKPPKVLHEHKSKYFFAADFDPERDLATATAAEHELWVPAQRGVVAVQRAMWRYFIGVKS